MPAKEIKELRQSGKIDEAYEMASSELEASPSDIWAKRNMSWVLYTQLDSLSNDLHLFIEKLNELKALNLPETETMIYDNISIVISKAVRNLTSHLPINVSDIHLLFQQIKDIPFVRPSKWYSALFQAFHKGFKETDNYLEFADWWDFSNFTPEDYQKEKMTNGKEIMAIAEQGYIAYSKHLLPKHSQHGEVVFNRVKVEAFLPEFYKVVENYPQLQYPPYFLAKLLLALGQKEQVLTILLPFAKKKKNDFWVWELIGEAYSGDEEKEFAFYNKALSCQSPEEMLINLRQKMASLFIQRKMYNEARTEIDLLVSARSTKGYKIPAAIIQWQSQEWYKETKPLKNNHDTYSQYYEFADNYLYGEIPEEKVIVEFVNSDKKILSYIASETKIGFLKYDRFLKSVNIGDLLAVRFQSSPTEGPSLAYTVRLISDPDYQLSFYKLIEGVVQIKEGNSFGFIEDAFIHPSIIKRHELVDGCTLSAYIMKTFNKDKKKWGWKVVQILK